MSVGDKLQLTTASGAGTPILLAGNFDLSDRADNERNPVILLCTARSLLAPPDDVTTLDLTVLDLDAARAVTQRIRAASGIEADRWLEPKANSLTKVAQVVALGPARRLADEPSHNLGMKGADEVFAPPRRSNTEQVRAVLFVTHTVGLSERCEKTTEVIDGRVIGI